MNSLSTGCLRHGGRDDPFIQAMYKCNGVCKVWSHFQDHRLSSRGRHNGSQIQVRLVLDRKCLITNG